jgi:cardiolipin synthase A/B
VAATAPRGTASAPLAATSSVSPHRPAPPQLSVLIEPDAGMGTIYAVLASPKRAVDLVMYELEDTRAEELLAGDAARGVDVRVILNRTFTGSANDAAFAYLLAHRVRVHWATSVYALTHQKTLIVDGAVGVVMTLNWTSRYYADTRDVAVLDRIPSDLAAMQATFNADYDGTRINAPAGVDLAWSPTTSLPDLLGLINGATRELFVENEEMGNADITAALIAAARRGVNVEICMTDSNSWAPAFAELTAGGVHIRVYAPDAALYIHAKVLVRDPGAPDQEGFAGSQNFSTESLRYNRELGIVISGGTLVAQLQATIQRDFNGATPWTGVAG